MQNSPAEMEDLRDTSRPIILLSTSGTRLMKEASDRGICHPACLRNARAQGEFLAAAGADTVILGADSRGQFRDEDRLCAARIARVLVAAGYTAADRLTSEVVGRWGDAADDAFLAGRSAQYLRDTAQEHDLEFVLGHIDDLQSVYTLRNGEVTELHAG
jgi:2-phosphosulfolactate phosphatase